MKGKHVVAAVMVLVGIGAALVWHARAEVAHSIDAGPVTVAAERMPAVHARTSPSRLDAARHGPPVVAPLPPAGAPLASTFSTLAQRAEAGDTAAACRLATDIVRCRTRAISTAAAEQLSAGLADPDVKHSGDGIGMVAALLNHNEALEGLCGSADDAMLASGFRFQALAADTDPESARWLAANPALDPDNVANELEYWAAYRRRAAAYFDRSLRERRAADLPLLLLVHASGRHQTLRPPYRDEDPSTFLGLLSAATSLGMDVPATLVEEGRLLFARGVAADPRIVSGWRGEVPERMAPAVVRAMHPEVRGHEFCGSGPG